MLTREEQEYVYNTIRKFIPDVLKKIHYVDTGKEVGHKFGDLFEDELKNMLKESDPDFTDATTIRGAADVHYKGAYIDIKFGLGVKGKGKKGNPNCTSVTKLQTFTKRKRGDCKVNSFFDALYVVVYDVKNDALKMFDVFDYMVYLNCDAGTGQTMLNESKITKNLVEGVNIPEKILTYEEKVIKIADIRLDALDRNIRLRTEQFNELKKEMDEYKGQSTLF